MCNVEIGVGGRNIKVISPLQDEGSLQYIRFLLQGS